ncbi:sulfurtransferase complex subunit TusC [Bowmanella dokdonensis]|nr:sulfurtransferase complex subunit TusC [Bowmanella dokdonensis]
MSSLAIVNQRGPHGSSQGQEALDLALVAGTFGLSVGLFFSRDGVFQLLKHQQPENILRKNYSKTFAALEFYDVDSIAVCAASLRERGLTSQSLCIEAELLEPQAFAQRISQFQHLVSF